MRNFFSLLITIMFLGISLSVLADDNRCPLTGNTYVFEVDDVRFELSGFVCTFGPGCEAKCDLWWGNFQRGPLYHTVLPFNCKQNGEVLIAGCPCVLTEGGDLECLLIDTTGFECYTSGNTRWCFSNKIPELIFKEKE
jgi:hypothetical protein